jgi:hypothetical protein
MLESQLTDFSVDEMVKPSRRSWQMLSKLKKTGIPANLFRELMFGAVGITATAAYEEYVKNAEKPISVEEILEGFKKIKKKVEKQIEGGRTDMLNKTCEDLEKYFSGETEVTEEQGKQVLEFVNALTSELCFSICRQLFIKSELMRTLMDKDKKLTKKLKEAKEAAKNNVKAS